MSDPTASIEFRRGVVEPTECIREGWQLIKDKYWLFVGMAAVGILIGNLVPFGLLMGPMMCGLYIALFKTRRGEPIEFGLLFKGFDHFGDSVIATLLHMIPILVIIVPAYIIFYVGLILTTQRSGGEPDPSAVMGLVAFFLVFWLVAMVIIMILSVVFTFAYPLIVDRRLSGINAVKLSIKAGLANFWRLLALLLLNGVLAFLGLLLCYVGMFLVLPINFAALAMAYERVFGLSQFQPNLPPPPPTFN